MARSRIANALATTVDGGEGKKWLTLKEASTVLGIHFTTLRSWADRGEIPVFRTPGGHRRFSLTDLEHFLEERASRTALATNADVLVESALGEVRRQMAELPPEQTAWRRDMDENIRRINQERGRRLFALAVNYVMKPQQRAEILEDGRRLGRDHGHDAVCRGISLVDTGRAVQFFRRQLLDTVRRDEALDAEDMRIRKLLTEFLDEVLYAVLEGYEATTKTHPDHRLQGDAPVDQG